MEFAKGGRIPEPRPIPVCNGYFVINQDILEHYGEEFLSQINQVKEGK